MAGLSVKWRTKSVDVRKLVICLLHIQTDGSYFANPTKLKKHMGIGALFLGENFAVFRTANGVASVLDAYCPHLGAHLGIGSRVVGDCVECPFHGWQFRGEDGQCMKIPYTTGKGI